MDVEQLPVFPPARSGANDRTIVLAALQHPRVAALLCDHRDLLTDLVDGLGSPLHIVLPEIFEENLARLRQIFTDAGVDADILFAKKANKADCFVRAAAAAGAGVDVASTPELVKALAGGVAGSRIGISGPEKDDTLHTLAVRHGCMIAVDSIDELRRLIATVERTGGPARVLLRSRADSQPTSRFGMVAAERQAAVELCASHGESVVLLGFSFHLSGYRTAERATVADDMIEHCLDARRRGIESASVVDIGGGLPVRYVEPQLWQDFLDQNASVHYHADKQFADFYPYGGQTSAEAMAEILRSSVGGRESLAEKASRHGIRFVIEPGRALLDQAGFTVYRVQQVDDRRPEDGYAILTVAGSSFSLSEQWFNSDYLPDPVLLSASSTTGEMFPACVAGSTCLESDMVTWRKIAFPRPVHRGDHLVYLNTAGYQMDSNESPFHDAPLPLKVVLQLGDGIGVPRWRLDGI